MGLGEVEQGFVRQTKLARDKFNASNINAIVHKKEHSIYRYEYIAYRQQRNNFHRHKEHNIYSIHPNQSRMPTNIPHGSYIPQQNIVQLLYVTIQNIPRNFIQKSPSAIFSNRDSTYLLTSAPTHQTHLSENSIHDSHNKFTISVVVTATCSRLISRYNIP